MCIVTPIDRPQKKAYNGKNSPLRDRTDNILTGKDHTNMKNPEIFSIWSSYDVDLTPEPVSANRLAL